MTPDVAFASGAQGVLGCEANAIPRRNGVMLRAINSLPEMQFFNCLFQIKTDNIRMLQNVLSKVKSS